MVNREHRLPAAAAAFPGACPHPAVHVCCIHLTGLPKSTTAPLQRAQDAAVRLVTGIGLHVTPALQQLHWLPVQYHITFKLCLLMHKIHTKRAPSYLTDKVTATADLQSRACLRSASTSKYQTPRIKVGERSFSYARPSAWNSLPHYVQEIKDTTRFKRQLKTVLFQRAFLDF